MSNALHDPLASALLPVVIHELNNATQLLTSLNTLLGMPGGEKFLTERAADLGSVGDEVLDLGWLLAALASSAGDDLLMTRRHDSGLEVMANYARKAIRRDGRDITLAEGPLPTIAREVTAGWEAAWALGVFLWSTARPQPEVVPWTWTRETDAWLFEADGPALAEHSPAELLHSRLEGASWHCTDQSTQLRLPIGWLELG